MLYPIELRGRPGASYQRRASYDDGGAEQRFSVGAHVTSVVTKREGTNPVAIALSRTSAQNAVGSPRVITQGIDLSASDKKTAICQLRWSHGVGSVETVSVGVGDDEIHARAKAADKIGIDAPLGWPVKFVDAVCAHKNLKAWPDSRSEELRLRETDRALPRGITPLSVSTNLIGITAMRAARLLDRIGEDVDCPRDGSGRVVEVYPAAALKIWGLPSKGYKKTAGRSRRTEILETLLSKTMVQMTPDYRGHCVDSDDALGIEVVADPLTAVVVRRRAARGQKHEVALRIRGGQRPDVGRTGAVGAVASPGGPGRVVRIPGNRIPGPPLRAGPRVSSSARPRAG